MSNRARNQLDVPPALRAIFEDIYLKLDRLVGGNNVDYKGRRIINAGRAQDDSDYVTLADLKDFYNKKTGRVRGGILGSGAGGSTGAGGGTGGGTGGSGGCSGRNEPTVDFPDPGSVITDYASAHPDQLANSCQDDGGTWDFMDGVIAALQAVDGRYGYNAKRGNCSDLSHDAISYYHGNLGSQEVCSHDCYVIDIIGGHCGPSPTVVFNDVTRFACGGWIPSRT